MSKRVTHLWEHQHEIDLCNCTAYGYGVLFSSHSGDFSYEHAKRPALSSGLRNTGATEIRHLARCDAGRRHERKHGWRRHHRHDDDGHLANARICLDQLSLTRNRPLDIGRSTGVSRRYGLLVRGLVGFWRSETTERTEHSSGLCDACAAAVSARCGR